MKVKPLLLALVFLISTPAFAYPQATSSSGELKATTTVAGSFYSSQQTLDRGFPFSDAVRTTGNLVFLSGLVGTDPDGELVEGGIAPETHAIFRQMQSHLQQLNLDLRDVVKCLVSECLQNIHIARIARHIITHHPQYKINTTGTKRASDVSCDSVAAASPVGRTWGAQRVECKTCTSTTTPGMALTEPECC